MQDARGDPCAAGDPYARRQPCVQLHREGRSAPGHTWLLPGHYSRPYRSTFGYAKLYITEVIERILLSEGQPELSI